MGTISKNLMTFYQKAQSNSQVQSDDLEQKVLKPIKSLRNVILEANAAMLRRKIIVHDNIQQMIKIK